MVKECAQTTGIMPRGGLTRKSVDGISDPPYKTSAVVHGLKALTELTNYVVKFYKKR